mmetsp:Transcript_81447/g.263819  ORF Transcript_81447/g.263819 Transcript_81447/m.263819 type:complete len:497 (+) Transcript_81447:246-1736(+)
MRHGLHGRAEEALPELQAAGADLWGHARHRAAGHEQEAHEQPRGLLEPNVGDRGAGRQHRPRLDHRVGPLRPAPGRLQPGAVEARRAQALPGAPAHDGLQSAAERPGLRLAEADLRRPRAEGVRGGAKGPGHEPDPGAPAGEPRAATLRQAAAQRHPGASQEGPGEVRGGDPERRPDLAVGRKCRHRRLWAHAHRGAGGENPDMPHQQLRQQRAAARHGRPQRHRQPVRRRGLLGRRPGPLPRRGAVRGRAGHALRERRGPGLDRRDLPVHHQELDGRPHRPRGAHPVPWPRHGALRLQVQGLRVLDRGLPRGLRRLVHGRVRGHRLVRRLPRGGHRLLRAQVAAAPRGRAQRRLRLRDGQDPEGPALPLWLRPRRHAGRLHLPREAPRRDLPHVHQRRRLAGHHVLPPRGRARHGPHPGHPHGLLHQGRDRGRHRGHRRVPHRRRFRALHPALDRPGGPCRLGAADGGGERRAVPLHRARGGERGGRQRQQGQRR